MNSRLEKIENWENLAQSANFQPDQLSALCGVSLRQLERFFKCRFRTTPRRWLRELQCHLAKELITAGYSTKAAAAELKFTSPARFCHAFKRIRGVPPQQPGSDTVKNVAAGQ